MQPDQEDDAGQSWCRHGSDGGQGCSTWEAKDEPPSDNDDNGGDKDYNVFYRRLGMN
jgi:hypothetical protein